MINDNPFFWLPLELHIQLSEYLTPKQIITLQRCCRTIKEIYDHEYIWKQKYLNKFGTMWDNAYSAKQAFIMRKRLFRWLASAKISFECEKVTSSFNPLFSPKGTFFVIRSSKTRIFRADDGKKLHTFPLMALHPCFSPDEDKFAYFNTVEIAIYKTYNFALDKLHPCSVYQMAFSRCGQSIYYLAKNHQIQKFNINENKTSVVLPLDPFSSDKCCFSQDGSLFASAKNIRSSHLVKIFDLESAREIKSASHASSIIYSIQFNPQATELVILALTAIQEIEIIFTRCHEKENFYFKVNIKTKQLIFIDENNFFINVNGTIFPVQNNVAKKRELASNIDNFAVSPKGNAIVAFTKKAFSISYFDSPSEALSKARQKVINRQLEKISEKYLLSEDSDLQMALLSSAQERQAERLIKRFRLNQQPLAPQFLLTEKDGAEPMSDEEEF